MPRVSSANIEPAWAVVESLDHEGRGVAHVGGKAIFIEAALPGETVEFSSYHKKPGYEKATCTQILHASAQRVTSACPHFGLCGGCSMQHLHPAAQAAAKQRVLEDALWHIGRLRPENVFPPIQGEAWGYRQRARFAARWVAKKDGALVGFHEKHSSFIVDMDSCAVLPATASRLLPALKALVGELSIRQRMPQIELAATDTQTALVVRNLAALSAADEVLLRAFADQHRVTFYVQPGGPETATLFYPPDAPPLSYALPDFGLHLKFSPTEFTQVNAGVNRMLVRRAMSLLAPKKDERIADLFCGLGNFSLPIARLGAAVLGVEGAATLVARARENAELNGFLARCEFTSANLFAPDAALMARLNACEKWLIDPPREGAIALVKLADGPRRIVYVSCNPATLARDAAVLVQERGYRLRGAGVVGMFPHTAHAESIAVFERE